MKSKFTPARRKRIVEAVREGMTPTRAFALAKVGNATGWDWMNRGEAGEEPYAAFYEAVKQAEAEFEAEMLGHVSFHARERKPSTWASAMTILERRFPERNGRRDTTIVEGGEQPIQVATHHVLHDPRARDLSNQLLKELAAPSLGATAWAGDQVEGELVAEEDITDGDSAEEFE